MRRFLTFLLISLALPCFAATVHFNLTNYNATTATNYIVIIPTNGPVVNAPQLIIGAPIRIPTTNGIGQSNLLTGTYTMQIYGLQYARPLLFTVPNDTATYEITALLTNGFSFSTTNPPFAQAIIAGANVTVTTNAGAYTIAANGGGVMTSLSVSNNGTPVGSGSSNIFEVKQTNSATIAPALAVGTNGTVYAGTMQAVAFSGVLNGNVAGPGYFMATTATGNMRSENHTNTSNIETATLDTTGNLSVGGTLSGNGGGLTNVNARLANGVAVVSNPFTTESTPSNAVINGGALSFAVTNDASGFNTNMYWNVWNLDNGLWSLNFGQTPGGVTYGQMFLNTKHDGAPGPHNSEFQWAAPHNIAMAPGYDGGGGGDGRLQFAAGNLNNLHSNGGPYIYMLPLATFTATNSHSAPIAFGVSAYNGAGVAAYVRMPAIFADLTTTNANGSYELVFTPDLNNDSGANNTGANLATWINTTMKTNAFRLIWVSVTNPVVAALGGHLVVSNTLTVAGNSLVSGEANFGANARVKISSSLNLAQFGVNGAGPYTIGVENGSGTLEAAFGKTAMNAYGASLSTVANFNGAVAFQTNALSSWPTVPGHQGDCAIVSSNGYPYMLLSTNGTAGSATWTGTNKLGW